VSARAWIILLVVAFLIFGGVVALRKLSETEESRLAKLRPEVRAAYEQLRAAAAAEGIQLYVISTARTSAEQDAKAAAGVSGTDDSWHELKRAIDFNVQIKDATTGKLRADNKGENVAHYKRVHELAPRFGLTGIPKGSPFGPDGSKAYITNKQGSKIWDVFHLEFREGMTFAQAAKRDASKAVA
jgi:hypothetical protein